MAAALVVLVMSPAVTLAQGSGEEMSSEELARQVEKLASQGAQAYRKGDFTSAIDYFERAYALEPVPNLLYNIAKSYEKQEKYQQAIDHYQKFAVAPEVDSEARQSALDRVDNLREIADLKEGDGSGAGDPSGDGRDRDRESSGQSKTAAWLTMGGGAALLATGVVFGLSASSAADEVQSGATFEQRQDAQKSGKTSALVADGAFIAGAVVTSLGLYLYFSDSDTETDTRASSTTVAPWVSTEAAGMGMSLDF
jgi:tetratricopeptide (TPR) repeat protein